MSTAKNKGGYYVQAVETTVGWLLIFGVDGGSAWRYATFVDVGSMHGGQEVEDRIGQDFYVSL